MTESVQIYGFGSRFHGKTSAYDVDLLIVHSDVDSASCHFAIYCKQLLSAAVLNADITMLSRDEEADLRFITQSCAMSLGHVRSGTVKEDVERIGIIIADGAHAQ
ncbi:hypothetical protein [Ollibium composti]|uniref:Polymerase nucleotidyl transferase domain-containing protein n=1 Tax=Ollibium composti TaxID=2675109 RepID=A0ABY2Q8P0_9HYPH|nr:hypothetical protein [Mesorhizobium composti]THF58206.1 hypothetical protein E6C48_06205 [Mesorhizobium composti]